MPGKSVLIITNAHPKGWLDSQDSDVVKAMIAFSETLNQRGQITVANTTVDALRFTIRGGSVSIYDTYTEQDISQYDTIHFKNVAHYWDFARAISHYMRGHGKNTLEMADENTPDYGKLSQMVLFGMNGVAVPDTYVAWRVEDVAEMLSQNTIALPWIIKSVKGIMGHDNYLVKNRDEIATINAEDQYVGQPYVPNDSDYRILFFGTKRQPLIFKKVAVDGSHLNNTSQGGQPFLMSPEDIGEDVMAMATKAAELTSRLLSGVDVMQNKETGEWMVLEVNANPALATGAFVEKKIELYEQLLKENI